MSLDPTSKILILYFTNLTASISLRVYDFLILSLLSLFWDHLRPFQKLTANFLEKQFAPFILHFKDQAAWFCPSDCSPARTKKSFDSFRFQWFKLSIFLLFFIFHQGYSIINHIFSRNHWRFKNVHLLVCWGIIDVGFLSLLVIHSSILIAIYWERDLAQILFSFIIQLNLNFQVMKS